MTSYTWPSDPTVTYGTTYQAPQDVKQVVANGQAMETRLNVLETTGTTQTLRTTSTATITPVSGDVGNTVRSTYDGLVTVTLPSDSTLSAWATGQSTEYIQDGNGPLSFVAGSGVSAIKSLSTLKRTGGKGARVRVTKIAANTYELSGDLAAPQDTFPSRLRTSGRNIVDANGYVMPKMKGFNIQAAGWSQATYNDFAAMGAKIQRLVMFWDQMEPTQGTIDSALFASAYDVSIARAQAAGIYTIIDIHLNVGRTPAWATTGVGELDKYYTYGQTVTAFIANRYGNPASGNYTKAVIGMGLNEPDIADNTIRNGTGQNPYLELRQAQMITWMRVNGNAPDWIGFVSTAYGSATPTYDTYSTIGNTGATNASHTAYDAVGGNIVLDFHDYMIGTTSTVANDDGRQFNGMNYPVYQGGPSLGTGDFPYEYTGSATAKSQMTAYVDPFKRFTTVGQIPLMLGEWGYPSGHPSTSAEEQWITDKMAIWNDAGTCIEMFWNYNVNAGSDQWSARPVGYAFRNSIQIWAGQNWAQNLSRTNESYSAQTGFASDTYLVGSALAFPSNLPQVATRYRLKFAMTKTAAGTAAPIITVRIGTPLAATVTNKALTSNVATITTSAAHGFSTGQTVNVTIGDTVFDGTYTIASTPTGSTFTYARTNANVTSVAATGTATRPAGTTVDPAILSFTFGVGTAAADTGVFDVDCLFRTVGSGTTAVLAGFAHLDNNAGLTATVRAAQGVSSGFDSTVANQVIGASFNGGTSFSGTCQLVDAALVP